MKYFFIVSFVISFLIFAILSLFSMNQNTIKIGLLYSQTGTMATEELAIAQALKYQVAKLNEEGGVLGKKVEIIEQDGASNDLAFAKGAQRLIDQGITTIFGCWTSASRKAVKPIIENHGAILFYPVQYEGLESSQNIVYMGSTPNQQINPMLDYIRQYYGNRVLVIGSNYIFPRISGIYLSQIANFLDINLLGEVYQPLGEQTFSDVVEMVQKLKPDAIINTLNGDSNLHFFDALHRANLSADQIPVFSTSIDERSIAKMLEQLSFDALDGHFLAGSYYHSLQNEKNSRLIEAYQQRYGKGFLLTDSGFNTHIAFEFWKRAVQQAGSTDSQKILNALRGDSLHSESGIVYLDRRNSHLHKTMRLARLQEGSLKVVWESLVLASPTPYPHFKSQSFWSNKETQLFEQWQKRWQSSESYQAIGGVP